MKPALFLSPHIGAYPVMMLLGFLLGWLLVRLRSRAYGIQRNHLDNLALLLPFAGLFGARLFARLFYAKLPLFEALKVWEGDGLVFYGGFIFGVATVVIYGLVRKLNLISLMDCCAPGVALGLAFGRVGCFLAGCCFGDICLNPQEIARVEDPVVVQRIYTVPAISRAGWPFAVQFPQKSDAFKQHLKLGLVKETDTQSLPVHPVQLYEAVLAALLGLGIHLATKKPRLPGSASLLLLLGYAFIRFGTEFLRADNKIYALHLTFSQLVSVYITLGCALVLVIRAYLFARARTDRSTNTGAELIRA
jgi:phosphatidylglycerol:prolipoprotein diacylglycerol transferase